MKVKEIINENNKSIEFKKWFGDSKVVDADGNPMVVYHGARSASAIRAFKGVSWFSETPGLASIYSMNSRDTYDTRSQVYPVYISVRNPIDFDAAGVTADNYMKPTDLYEKVGIHPKGIVATPHERAVEVNRIIRASEFVDAAQSAGYDGYRIREHDSSGVGSSSAMTWAAFRPEQVKSAIGNRGTYDSTRSSIIDENLKKISRFN